MYGNFGNGLTSLPPTSLAAVVHPQDPRDDRHATVMETGLKTAFMGYLYRCLTGLNGTSWDIIWWPGCTEFSLALEHGLEFKNGQSSSVTYWWYHELDIVSQWWFSINSWAILICQRLHDDWYASIEITNQWDRPQVSIKLSSHCQPCWNLVVFSL